MARYARRGVPCTASYRMKTMTIDSNRALSPVPARYGRIAQLIHWATAALVLAAFLYGPGGPEARVYAPPRDVDRPPARGIARHMETLRPAAGTRPRQPMDGPGSHPRPDRALPALVRGAPF